jgi:hypothetical protein
MKKATAFGHLCQFYIYLMIIYNGQEGNGEVWLLESKAFSSEASPPSRTGLAGSRPVKWVNSIPELSGTT